jgi:hypothetical protein
LAGSDKRQRSRMVSIRLTPTEAARLEADAVRAGLSLGGYARQVLLGAPPPRQSRRPPVERELLAQAMRQLGRIGGNVNQLAHSANCGITPDLAELRAACLAVIEARNVLLRALGVSEPEAPPPGAGAPRP